MKTREIADFLSLELEGDPDLEIIGVADISRASENELSFAENAAAIENSRAGCIFLRPDLGVELDRTVIKTVNPKFAFARIGAVLHSQKSRTPERHPSAIVAATAVIGNDVFLGAFTCVGEGTIVGDGTQVRAGAKVGDNVSIGSNCVLHPNVFIEDGSTIGNNVILHAGVVIGADGFGYVRDASEYVKFPQIGSIVIENDVEIGANSCIDRGALGETRIGAGTKIDNLVQIAHNVQIGKRVVIAAQTGISGSTVIEDDCVIGGQVGMGDHARVLSGAIIGSQAGVLPGKIVRPGVWWGTPVQPLVEYKRQNAHVKSLERIKNDVKDLKKRLEGSTKNS